MFGCVVPKEEQEEVAETPVATPDEITTVEE
jgi:hypothetical protein